MKTLLHEHIGIPVIIGNTVEVMTLAEKYLGHEESQTSGNLVYLYVGSGIGAGIISHGSLYRGSRFSSVEIGHTTIDLHGPQCRCGNQGCLEVMASVKTLFYRVNYLLDSQDVEPVTSIPELLNKLEEHRELLRPVLMDLAGNVGVGIANMINTFNPEVIVIAGWPNDLRDEVFSELRRVALARSLEGMSEGVRLVPSPLDEKSVVLGAASLVVQALFKGEISF